MQAIKHNFEAVPRHLLRVRFSTPTILKTSASNMSQYTVLVRSRPARAAFLIDTEKFTPGCDRYNALLDAIVDWNNSHWGGRTNHIGFFTGETLSTNEWRELDFADPDSVLAFAPLPQNLIRELDERLNPWSITEQNAVDSEPDRISIPIEGIGMPPTVENLHRLQARDVLGSRSEEKLLMFEFVEGCDPEIRRFIHRNFGTYYQWLDRNTGKTRRIAWLEELLPLIPTQTFAISDVNSLAAALTELSGKVRRDGIRPPLPFVAPYQLASLFLKSYPTWELHQTYQVIIGDSAVDFAEHWNGVLWKRNWWETHKHQLWIPTKLANDPIFRESLHDWLCRYTNRAAGHRIQLLSNSLPEDRVTDIQNYFRQHELPLHLDFVSADQIAQRRQRAEEELAPTNHFFPWTADDDVLRFTGFSNRETFELPKPDPLQGKNQDGRWAVDVQIEHIKSVRSTMREHSWWYLPRLNSGGVLNGMFRAPARINRGGRFSVHVESHEQHWSRRIKPELKVHLCSDAALVRSLVNDPHSYPFSMDDARKRLPKMQPAIAESRPSTKGAYLAGLIDLFGNFWTATSFCERRFWRLLFNRLAGHGTGEGEKLTQSLVEILNPELSGTETERSEHAATLSEKILRRVRGRLKGYYASFNDCLQERSRLEKKGLPITIMYPQGEIMIVRHGETPISKKQMKSGLNTLLDIGVLRLGVESRCPQCTLFSWYHVDELRQQVTCSGCGSKYALKATEAWRYALNTLAQMSVSQGVLAVLQALIAIESHARWFFAFSPSLDLFKRGENKVWRAVDVLCVVDGDVVIGEVKDGFVQKSDFDKLAEVAEVLRPQRAIIFLPAEIASKQTDEVKSWLNEQHSRLNPNGIKAEIFTLPMF